MKNEPFFIKRPPPGRATLPIVISSPHSGTEIPADIEATMNADVARAKADTDWFVHELYDFAPALGITMIHARCSRFVVDLNRDPEGAKLYRDGRKETGLVPVKTFGMAPIYRSEEPGHDEIQRRVAAYYTPYHAAIRALLDELRKTHRHVLLWDAHSIKRYVPSVRPEPFADVILGNQHGKTAAAALIDETLAVLGNGTDFDVSHNVPFMGGYITRSFGDPSSGVHALQLEMAQDLYMDEAAGSRDSARQARVRIVLERTLTALAATLRTLT